VFKNPSSDLPAGKLIEECGLKGLAEGGAQVSSLHANWIINPLRRASAQDVRALMERCIETVASRSGVVLEPELLRWF
jgi:UDP-N-acetylmuramate dehydrogenase